jgi:hypothetical protein
LDYDYLGHEMPKSKVGFPKFVARRVIFWWGMGCSSAGWLVAGLPFFGSIFILGLKNLKIQILNLFGKMTCTSIQTITN